MSPLQCESTCVNQQGNWLLRARMCDESMRVTCPTTEHNSTELERIDVEVSS